MTSEAVSHQRNLESSLLFLQQQHADTLRDLHDEIAKLQKKCSELTFEIAMVTPETDKDNGMKLNQLGSELEAKRKDNTELQQDSEKKDKRMKMLEQQLRAQEKKFQDDLKTKNLTINTLKRELDSKSNNIAFLTTEMHRMKKRIPPREEHLADNLNTPMVVPAPPKDRSTRPRRTTHKRVEVGNGNINSSLGSRRLLRGSSGQSRGSGRSNSPVEVPDPTPFLQRNSGEKRPLIKPTPPPLPPIAAHAIENARNGGTHVVFRSAGHDTRTVSSRRPTAVPIPEVETLAVNHLPGTTSAGKWGRAHESKSSEYN